MPLNKKGEKIKKAMEQEYGKKRGMLCSMQAKKRER